MLYAPRRSKAESHFVSFTLPVFLSLVKAETPTLCSYYPVRSVPFDRSKGWNVATSRRTPHKHSGCSTGRVVTNNDQQILEFKDVTILYNRTLHVVNCIFVRCFMREKFLHLVDRKIHFLNLLNLSLTILKICKNISKCSPFKKTNFLFLNYRRKSKTFLDRVILKYILWIIKQYRSEKVNKVTQ